MKNPFVSPINNPQPCQVWLLQADRSVLVDTFPSEGAANRHINRFMAPNGLAYRRRFQ